MFAPITPERPLSVWIQPFPLWQSQSSKVLFDYSRHDIPTMLSPYSDPFILAQEYVAFIGSVYPTPVNEDPPAILSMPPTPDISNATLTSGYRNTDRPLSSFCGPPSPYILPDSAAMALSTDPQHPILDSTSHTCPTESWELRPDEEFRKAYGHIEGSLWSNNPIDSDASELEPLDPSHYEPVTPEKGPAAAPAWMQDDEDEFEIVLGEFPVPPALKACGGKSKPWKRLPVTNDDIRKQNKWLEKKRKLKYRQEVKSKVEKAEGRTKEKVKMSESNNQKVMVFERPVPTGASRDEIRIIRLQWKPKPHPSSVRFKAEERKRVHAVRQQEQDKRGLSVF